MNAKNFLLLTFIALAGCDDPTDVEFRGDYSDVVVVCEGPNCWAKSPAWDAWAAAVTNEKIDDAVSAGVWIPTRQIYGGDQCWSIAGTDSHVCVVFLGSVKLMGRPTSELLLSPPGQACYFEGEWTSNAEALGYCFGILDDVAIQLDIDPF